MKTIIHIPHSSKYIPSEYLDTYLIDDLNKELDIMTDTDTDKLVDMGDNVILFPYSRLFCDVERFDSDEEIMNDIGMGILYTKTHDGRELRKEPDIKIKEIYYEHHRKINNKVKEYLEHNDKILFIDLHSYSKTPQPYELFKDLKRPEICIGVNDDYDEIILNKIIDIIESFGYEYDINAPFKGSLVPSDYFNDDRILSFMIEIRKDIYDTENKLNNIKKIMNSIINI